MSEKGKNWIRLTAAFLAGILIASVVFFMLTKPKENPSQQAEQTAKQESDTLPAESASDRGIDFATVFPS